MAEPERDLDLEPLPEAADEWDLDFTLPDRDRDLDFLSELRDPDLYQTKPYEVTTIKICYYYLEREYLFSSCAGLRLVSFDELDWFKDLSADVSAEVEAGEGDLEWPFPFATDELAGEAGFVFLELSDSFEGEVVDLGEPTDDGGLQLSVGLLITGASKQMY